jgi:two-component system cell cycle sensor histidine kinase/response regulator CckA
MVGTVLVVDDDEAICDLVAETLSPYTVLSAITGEDALRMLRSPTPIDVLLTDVVLPGRYDGFALARQAKALRPALKVFYASGYYSGLPSIGDGETFYGAFIAKPFRAAELRAEIARALAEPANQRVVRPALRRWRNDAAA